MRLLLIALLLGIGPVSAETRPATPAVEPLSLSPRTIELAKKAARVGRAYRLDRRRRRPAGLRAIDSADEFQAAAARCVAALEATRCGSDQEQQALAELEYLGRYATRPLITGLGSDNPVVRKRCAVKLGRHGRVAADSLTDVALHDDVGFVRTAAIASLGCLCDPACGPVLVRLLDDENDAIVRAALGALAYLNLPATIDPIERFLTRDGLREELIREVEDTLDQLDSRKRRLSYFWPVELADLRQLTIDAGTAVGEGFGESEIEALLAHIDSENGRVSTFCLMALGELRAEEAVPSILRLESIHYRRDATLAQIASPASVDFLLAQLQSASAEERDAAFSGMQQGAGRWAVPIFAELLDDPSLRTVDDREPEGHEPIPSTLAIMGYPRIPRFPDGHRAHSALMAILQRAGVEPHSVNVLAGTFDVDKEIDEFRVWWSRHAVDFVDRRPVDIPRLTSVYFVFGS